MLFPAPTLFGRGATSLKPQDVFATSLYTGTGSAQTITNGLDLSGEGGLVWIKTRGAARNHRLYDTSRGATIALQSNLTDGNTTVATGLSAFTASGFTLGSATGENASAETHVAWSFREAPKFFDVVTYTGTGSNRTIAHALGQEVGTIYIKRTDTTADWQVYHRSLANTEYLVLNTTAAKTTGASRWNSTTPTISVFSLGTDTTVNASGGTYVAYLFAHDTAADGIVQCRSFTTDGSGNATVTLGWQPQYILWKVSSGVGNWEITDSARGFVSGADARLFANTSGAESSFDLIDPTSDGFTVSGVGSSSTYIYLAIRAPI